MGLAVLAATLVGREQPRAVVRLGHVGVHRLSVLGGRDGRGVLRRSLGEDTRDLGELGNWELATLAVGVGGTDAETERGGGNKHGLHGLSPDLPVLGAGLLGFVIRPGSVSVASR